MKQYVLVISLLFLLQFSNSCKSKRIGEPIDSDISDSSQSTFNTIQRKIILSSDTSIYNHCFKLGKMLGLDDLKNEFFGGEIRIWLEYALSDSGKLIVIQMRDSAWSSRAYYYKANLNQDNELISLEKKVDVGNPRSGWSSFSKEINNSGIDRLKSYNEIPNYHLCNGGDGVIIEISKSNLYRNYYYPCFDVYEKNIREIKNIKKLLLLIQRELDYKLFPRPKFKLQK